MFEWVKVGEAEVMNLYQYFGHVNILKDSNKFVAILDSYQPNPVSRVFYGIENSMQSCKDALEQHLKEHLTIVFTECENEWKAQIGEWEISITYEESVGYLGFVENDDFVYMSDDDGDDMDTLEQVKTWCIETVKGELFR